MLPVGASTPTPTAASPGPPRPDTSTPPGPTTTAPNHRRAFLRRRPHCRPLTTRLSIRRRSDRESGSLAADSPLGAVQEVLPVGSAGVRDRPLGPVARVVAE